MRPAYEAVEAGSSPWRAVRRVAISLLVIAAVAVGIYLLDSDGGRAGPVSGIDPAGASGTAPRIGELAPGFEALDLSGERVTLAEYAGRPVWLSFWASWCPPCRAEAPEVEAAYREARDSGLALLAISVGESAESVRRYVETVGPSYTVLLDPDQRIAARYRVNGLPTHYFIDRSGVVQGVQVGGLSKSAFLKRLETILRPS